MIECFITSIKKEDLGSQEPINSVVRDRDTSLCEIKGWLDTRISEMKRKSEPLFIEGTISQV